MNEPLAIDNAKSLTGIKVIDLERANAPLAPVTRKPKSFNKEEEPACDSALRHLPREVPSINIIISLHVDFLRRLLHI